MLAYLVTHGLHDHYFLVAIQPAAVNQPAGRFIYRNQPFILIEYFQH